MKLKFRILNIILCIILFISVFNFDNNVLDVKAIDHITPHSFPKTTDDEGNEIVDTESAEYKACKEVYDVLMSQYQNPYVVCGILGNLIWESGGATLDPAVKSKSGYKGIAQWNPGRWKNLTEFAGSDNNKYGKSETSRITQAYFIIYEMPQFFPKHNITIDEFLSLQDTLTACEVFAACYEICVNGNDEIESQWFINKWGGMDYKSTKFQNLQDRRGWALACSQVFIGTDVTYYQNGNISQVTNETNEVARKGSLWGESELGVTVTDWYDTAITLPSSSDLETSERVKIENWKDDVNGSRETGVIKWLRSVVAFVGIVIVIYSTIIYIAYWFDRLNNIVDISLLNVLTMGRLEISPDDRVSTFSPSTQGKKVVNHRDVIFISLLGIAFGVVLLSGIIYNIIYWILSLIKKVVG